MSTNEWRSYAVGADNIEGGGDQKKFFTSKSTLIFADYDFNVQFNNRNNVPILIMADTWYEFKSNIFMVHYQPVDTDFTADVHIYFYFEGVLPEQARRPE